MAKKPNQEASIEEELSELLATDTQLDIVPVEVSQNPDEATQEASSKEEEEVSSSDEATQAIDCPVQSEYRLTSAMSLHGTLYHIGEMIDTTMIDQAVLHDLVRRGVLKPVSSSHG